MCYAIYPLVTTCPDHLSREHFSISGTNHSLAHDGQNLTLKLVSQKFVLKKLVNRQSIVLRASTAKFMNMFSRQMCRKRFSHNHIDFPGPIPPLEGSTYVFLTIDLTNMWLSALSTTDSLRPDCATALVRHWKNDVSYLHK